MSQNQAQQARAEDPYAPKNIIERVIYWTTRTNWSWNTQTAVQMGAVSIAFSMVACSGLFLFAFAFALGFGVIEVRWKWGQPQLDLTDSQYERCGEEAAHRLIDEGWRPPVK